jgi:hypothetical protein
MLPGLGVTSLPSLQIRANFYVTLTLLAIIPGHTTDQRLLDGSMLERWFCRSWPPCDSYRLDCYYTIFILPIHACLGLKC